MDLGVTSRVRANHHMMSSRARQERTPRIATQWRAVQERMQERMQERSRCRRGIRAESKTAGRKTAARKTAARKTAALALASSRPNQTLRRPPR